jgi:malate dehydrogenase (quinone)
MINVIDRRFSTQLSNGGWKAKLKEIVPSYGESLIDNVDRCRRVRAETAAVLGLQNITVH